MRISDWSSDVCSSDLLLNRIVVARAEGEIDQLASALAQAAADIVARDDQILAALILAPHDDMCVRMAGVVMIDRDPVEIRPKVFLDSGHEPPGERLEVVIFYPVLGAHNDAELVAIVARLLEPVVPVHLVRVGPLELPRSEERRVGNECVSTCRSR